MQTEILKTKYQGHPIDDLAAYQRGLKKGLKAAAEYWQKKYAPGHFTRAAKSKYNYEPRTAKHEIRKARLFGHRDPLVFTGETRKFVKGRRAPARVSNKDGNPRAKLSVKVPTYFYQYNKTGKNIDKAGELLATTSDEAAQMFDRIVDAFIKGELDKARRKKRRKVARG